MAGAAGKEIGRKHHSPLVLHLGVWLVIVVLEQLNKLLERRVTEPEDSVATEIGTYKATGIRLDSGDLAYLSCESQKSFQAIEKEFEVPNFGKTGITASNDLNKETLDALNKHVHAKYMLLM